MKCPVCGHPFTDHLAVGPPGSSQDLAGDPEPGDWTVCIKCAEPLVFVTPTTLRRLVGSDLVDEASDEKIALLGQMRHYVRIARSREN